MSSTKFKPKVTMTFELFKKISKHTIMDDIYDGKQNYFRARRLEEKRQRLDGLKKNK